MILNVELPIRTVSEANLREHFMAKAQRAKRQRAAALLHLRPLGVPELPVRITLTRISPGKVDTDNLARACKAVRDGISDWLGCDDGDPRITWVYAQEVRGKLAAMRIFTRGGRMKRASDIKLRVEIDRP